LSKPVQGCAFAPRCDYAQDQCRRGEITLKEIENAHASACVRVQKGEVVL
jgi:oligopeptide transport system ATP-binding protein